MFSWLRHKKPYVCDSCGQSFSREQLDRHYVKTAQEAVGILQRQAAQRGGAATISWTGSVHTFDADGNAWCPNCAADAASMPGARRTVRLPSGQPRVAATNAAVEQEQSPALFRSLRCGDVEAARGLIDGSPGLINARDPAQLHRTPLHYAAQLGEKDFAEFLLSKGADLSAKDDTGRLALNLAWDNAKVEVVKLLFSAHSDKPAR